MLAYILLVLAFLAFIMLIPMLPQVVRAAQKRLGTRHGGVAFVAYLEEHMPADLLPADEPEEKLPSELEELTGGTHFPEEYKDIVDMTMQPSRIHELPLAFFTDFSSYHRHKALVQHKPCRGVYALDASFDEVVVYHINSNNPLAELLGLVVQAKNQYIPHPSLNLSDSFNLDRAFVVVIFSGNAPHPDFLQYLELINNLHCGTTHGRRFLALHNNLHKDLESSLECSALHLPHKDYYIVLDSQMHTSQLPQSGTTHFKMIPWTTSAIHRYVVQDRPAPHVDLFVPPPAEPPTTLLARTLADIPASLYHKEFLRCEDLFRDGVPLAQQLEFHRARESLAAIPTDLVPAGEHLLIHVLGEQFDVPHTIGLLTALCRNHRVLVVPPTDCGPATRNKLCALELWCRSAGQHLLGHTTHCLHVQRGTLLYCLCCAPCHGDALHIYFHPKEPTQLPHLAYHLQPTHSLTYVFKD